jgi:putative CocE/NonD family hydrolase
VGKQSLTTQEELLAEQQSRIVIHPAQTLAGPFASTTRLAGVPLLAFILALPPAAAQDFDFHNVTQVMVPMRDGTKLAADVYRPAHGNQQVEGKFPVLVMRTPYNKTGYSKVASYFAQLDYIFVVQDCRGRFASEGEFYPFINEGKDGYDTIEWAGTQPWSNGKVGTIGASYMAWDQYLASLFQPSHLTAMFVQVGGANFYNEYGYPGGAPNLGWSTWILNSAASSPEAAKNPVTAEPLKEVTKNLAAWQALHPQKRAEVFRAFPFHLKVYEDYYNHPAFDDYWKQYGFYTPGYYKRMKDIPIFFATGWYDYFAEGVLENFSKLQHLQKTHKKLMVGPWPHGLGRATCGDVFYGDQAVVDPNAVALDWFDHWLKGRDFRRVGSETVRFFRMGGGGLRNTGEHLAHGGEWLATSTWPPPGLQLSKYYLRADRALSSQQAVQENPSSYVFDPDHPIPTIGGRYGHNRTLCGQNQVCSPDIPGCSDALPLDKREDVLSFSTAPLDSPLEVTGKVRCMLWVSSDAVDTDFTAKLVDVYPDGYALILADGVIRTRYRKDFERPVLMKPGKVYEVLIDLGSTSNLFQKGHRIRLDVSSSNYPAIEPNPNTGEPPGSWTHRVKARNSVYHDAKRPSYLLLPIQKARRKAPAE